MSAQLEELKNRLAALGVTLDPETLKAEASNSADGAPERLAAANKSSDEVGQLLDRCNKIEAMLNESGDEDAGHGRDEDEDDSDDEGEAPARPAELHHIPTELPVMRSAAAKKARPASAPAKKKTGSTPSKPRLPLTRTGLPSTSPLGSVLQQYKEAEAYWAQEKGKLRREALVQRKRANKLDLDYKKLQGLYEHRTVDVKALKLALKNRDSQLQVANRRIRDLEESLETATDSSVQQINALTAERDDLKKLLVATLKRLETVDEVVQRADESSAVLQDKMVTLEQERVKALEAAALAASEVEALAKNNARLEWQQQLLQRMSDLQLQRGAQKGRALEALLLEARRADVTLDTTRLLEHDTSVSDSVADRARRLLAEPPRGGEEHSTGRHSRRLPADDTSTSMASSIADDDLSLASAPRRRSGPGVKPPSTIDEEVSESGIGDDDNDSLYDHPALPPNLRRLLKERGRA